MVLSNVEIWAELDAKRLSFDPPVVEEDRFGSSSVDLLLHEDLLILPETMQDVVFNPAVDGSSVMAYLEARGRHHLISRDGPYVMEPNRLIIGRTLENITLPPHLAARIEGKSSLARVGLSIHVTAPTVLAGFSGRLILEMNNIGPFPVQLNEGMRIAQLILEHVGLPPLQRYSGQYQNQR